MSFKRLGLSFIDKDQNRASQDRDTIAAVQDLQGVEVETVTHATANTEFELVHNLRSQIPRSVVTLLSSKGGVIYSSRVADWNARRIFLKSTVAADTVLLWVR